MGRWTGAPGGPAAIDFGISYALLAATKLFGDIQKNVLTFQSNILYSKYLSESLHYLQ